MPPAAHAASRPMGPLSTSVTATPAFASLQAIAEPTMPPPTTRTSGVRAMTPGVIARRAPPVYVELLRQAEQDPDGELGPVGAEVPGMRRILGEHEPEIGGDDEGLRELVLDAETDEEQQVRIAGVVAGAGHGDIRDGPADAERAVGSDRPVQG